MQHEGTTHEKESGYWRPCASFCDGDDVGIVHQWQR